MKIKNFISYFVIAAATFGLAACNDTDAQYTIPQVDAPVLVSSDPGQGEEVKGGDRVITLEFDKNIGFASANYSQITLTGGGQVTSATVYGASKTLTINTTGTPKGAQCTLTIPAGLVTGPNKVPAGEITLSYSTKPAPPIDAAPVMATQAKAIALYNYLKANYGKGCLSGMVAEVAWNNTSAEQVYQWTGKYPAINGYDYIHMPASVSGANWINYGDITPVKEWADNGGIVTIGWHWVVPCKAVEAGAYSGLNPNTDYTYFPGKTEFDLKNATVEGTWEKAFVDYDLANLAAYLKLVQDAGIPVLWRPLHEAAGGWFWWGTDAEAFKALWKYMFDYLKAQGINNLIWVWTSQTGDDNWYPGDNYVDIVGRDLYGDNATSCADNYANLSTKYSNKIVTLSECGWSDYTTSRVATIADQWAAGAKWSWFMPWYDGSEAVNKHADEAWWKAAMESSFVISRDKVKF